MGASVSVLAGAAGMTEHLPPTHQPQPDPDADRATIIKVRVLRRWGPARIGYLLGLHPSTVHRVLTRYRLARWPGWTAPPAGSCAATSTPHPGDLVHLDVKKLGNIPDGGGWRVHGTGARADATASAPPRFAATDSPVIGYDYLHTALDDHSRLAYTEPLTDEPKTPPPRSGTAPAPSSPPTASPSNASSPTTAPATAHAPSPTPSARITHKRTRPYRPQTNGKVERFHRTLADEWAYARPYRSTPNDATLSRLAPHLQPPPRPHRTRRPTTSHPRPQPLGSVHLAIGDPHFMGAAGRIVPATPRGEAQKEAWTLRSKFVYGATAMLGRRGRTGPQTPRKLFSVG